MATYKSISIAFGNALAQAQKLENSAEQMRNASRQLDTVKESLRSEWEGESASLYLQKCDALKQKLEKTAGDLVQIAPLSANLQNPIAMRRLRHFRQLQQREKDDKTMIRYQMQDIAFR